MAISVIATAAANGSSGAGGTASITHGLTIASGDVLIAVFHAYPAGAIASTGDYQFTEDYARETDTNSLGQCIYSRVAGASEPSAFAKLTNVSFVGLFSDVQADVAGLQGIVESILNANAGITSAAWGDTMIGDYRREDEMTTTEYALAVLAYPSWAAGKAYKVADLCSYAAALYEVVQAHTSQADWTPDVVPALFTRRSPAGVIPVWVQPTGASDAYALGALVIFEGKVYESLIAANVWSPTVYPAGWELVG